MLKKSIVLVITLFLISSVHAQSKQRSQQEFVKKLYSQGVLSLSNAKKKCVMLSKNNRQLVSSMANVHNIAKEKKNPSVPVFAETDYLLGFLQERIDDVCGKIRLANEESVKIIVASELTVLVEKMEQSKSYAEYIDSIFGTEYSKFLYLTATPDSLEKMHKKWAVTMATNRKNIAQMIVNIQKGNKVLREELTSFTKAFKLYYEDAAGIFDEKNKKNKASGLKNDKK